MIPADMAFLDRLERRFGWLSFPGFLRYYALFHVLVFGLQFVRPDIGDVLGFDQARILDGEVWRLVTFLFASSGFGGGGLGVIFMFFMVMIAFLMSDALESAWGVFRTSMFYYFGILCLIGVNFIVPVARGIFLYEAAFFAFATLFPRTEFRLFLIIPVQVKFLAILLAVVMLLPVLDAPLLLPLFFLCFLNYILWAGIPALRGQAKVVQSAKRRRRFNEAKTEENHAFHRCAVCGRNDVDDPELEFRVGPDGREYCEEHTPE